MKEEADAQAQKLKQVAQLWKGAYTVEGSSDKTVQALALGRNFRINVAKALEAAYSTIKVVTEAVKVHAGQFADVDWLGLGAEAIHAITATFGALVESMLPLEYVACVMLSGHPGGLKQDQLRVEIEEFLKNPKSKKLPWYLGMSKSHIRDAYNATKVNDWFPHLLDELRKDNWVIGTGEILKFKTRNFELGFKFV